MISDDAREGQQVLAMALRVFNKGDGMSLLSKHFPCRSPDLTMAQDTVGCLPHFQGHSTPHCRVGRKRAATFKGTAVSQGANVWEPPTPAIAQAPIVSIRDEFTYTQQRQEGVPGGLAEVPKG